MNIQSVIEGIRAQWAAKLPEVPLHLQVAPESVQVPYCVMRFGTIDPADTTTEDKDYQAPVTFICYSATDAECLARIDAICAAFDGTRYGAIYSSLLSQCSFDINITDPAALWSSEIPFAIRWNQ